MHQSLVYNTQNLNVLFVQKILTERIESSKTIYGTFISKEMYRYLNKSILKEQQSIRLSLSTQIPSFQWELYIYNISW